MTFVPVTRAAACAALAAGKLVRLDATGEIVQLENTNLSKRHARRFLSSWASWGYWYNTEILQESHPIKYSVNIGKEPQF